MPATFYKYRVKDGTHIAVFRVSARDADSIPFENRERLELKVTPAGQVLIGHPKPKEITPEDAVIKLRDEISEIKIKMRGVASHAYAAAQDFEIEELEAASLVGRMGLTFRDVARDLSKFETLEKNVERLKEKSPDIPSDVVEKARRGYLILKPFYLKWKKLMAEKESLEKECEERAAKL